MFLAFHLPSNIFQVPKQEWCFTSYSSQYIEHFLAYLNYTPVNYSGKPRPLHNLGWPAGHSGCPLFSFGGVDLEYPALF